MDVNHRFALVRQLSLFSGISPAVRKSRIAQVDVRDLSILRWTDRYYYEVCANPAVEAALPGDKSAGAGFSR